MMLAGSKHWALFRAISPLFTSDIPWRSAGRGDAETPAVQEAGTLLRAHISEIPFHVPQDAAFSERTPSHFTAALESLLLALEALVQPSVLDDAAALGESQADLVEKYPKLSALSLFIGDDNFSIVHCHRFLCLNQRAVLLKATLSFAEDFLEEVRQLFRGSASMVKDGFVAGNHLSPSSQPQYSQIFRDCSVTLYNTLENNLRQCTSMSSKHKAFFHLKASPNPTTGSSSAELDLLLALCPRGNSWQEVRFTVPSHTGSIPAAMTESHEQLIEDICQVAREAYERQQAVSIYVHDNKLHDTSSFDDEPNHPEAEYMISLSSLLDDGVLRDRFKFPLVHKRILALTLARNLLNLYEVPWIQTDWSAENILFAYSTNGTNEGRVYDIHQPYLPCTLSPEHEFQAKVSDPIHDNPLILSFGRLLLEVDKGERIAITKTVRSKPSLYRTLVAELDEMRKELLTPSYAQAVEGCLKFPKWLQENRGMSRELAYRQVILEKILNPLELEARTFPNQGAGSRDIDLIHMHISPTDNASPSVSTSSIRGSTAVSCTPASARADASRTTLGRVSRSKAMAPSRIGIKQPQTSRNTKSSTLTISASRCPPTSSSSRIYASVATRSSPVSHPCLASRVSPTKPTRRYEQSARQPTQSGRLTSISRCTQISFRPENARDMPNLTRPCAFMFSENEMDLSEDKKSRAKEFLKRFENFRLRNVRRCPKAARVRIAVLDTGLDDRDIRIRALKRGIKVSCRKMENINYRDPVRGKRNFVSGSPDHDEDGHGTNVICLLLTLAPEADLFVGKISRGKKCGNQDDGMVAALRWAVDEVKADVISMSFGFSGWDDDMDRAIKDSFAAGRIAFAAASNCGGNSCRTYPAKAGTVFCIHASDGYGNQSGLDPTPIRGDFNFSTLGVAVPCGYTRDGEIFKTGTSYATPVAAGLAANILDLADWLAAEGELTPAQRKKLRSYEGMRNMFELMAPSRRQGYDYVAPWNLWNGKVEEKIIWGKIREKLS